MQTPLGELAWSDEATRFGNDKRDTLTKQCQSCQFRFACNGGCPKHRILTSKDGEPGHNYFCESYTMFFKHAGERLQVIAAQAGLTRVLAFLSGKAETVSGSDTRQNKDIRAGRPIQAGSGPR